MSSCLPVKRVVGQKRNVMVYEPNIEKNIKRSREIIKARKWGVNIILSIAGIGMFVSEFQRILSIEAILLDYLGLCLFLATGLLILFWIWATDKELDMLFEWLDPGRYKPPSTVVETLLILSFAVLLITLLFAARYLLLYSIVFTIYSIVGLPTERHLTRQLKEAIAHSKNNLSSENQNDERIVMYSRAVAVIEEYFITRPMRLRSWIVALISVSALCFAIYWKYSNTFLSGVISYSLLIFNIVWSEGLINYWRIVRDNKMRPLEAQLIA